MGWLRQMSAAAALRLRILALLPLCTTDGQGGCIKGGVPSLHADPYYPVFHARPASGHVNDPNAPFVDPATGLVHLFMQYSPAFPYRPHKISWAHLVSRDWVHWESLGVAIQPDGQGCNNTRGAYSGSASIVDGVPTIFYPGVHFNSSQSFPYLPDQTAMDQCIATPVNRADGDLRRWNSRTFIPADRTPEGVSNHFHDDSNAWVSKTDGRRYMFVSGCGCSHETGPCIPPNCSHATNILFSSVDLVNWRQEHSFFNFTGYGNFVSCPELYTLPGVSSDAAPLGNSDTAVYYGNDQYWLGSWSDATKMFTPHPAFLPPQRPQRKFMYDFGEARASKSFWDAKNERRVQWAYIDDCTSSRQCQRSRPGWNYVQAICPSNPAQCWDNAQTVARVITHAGDHLHIAPLPELNFLRTNGGVARIQRRTQLAPWATATIGVIGTVCDIVLNVSNATAGGSIHVLASTDGSFFTEITWNASVVSLFRDRSGTTGRSTSLSMPVRQNQSSTGAVSLRILLDNFVVEVFEVIGGTALTAVVFPDRMVDAARATVQGGSTSVNLDIAVYGMESCMVARGG